MIPKSIVGSKIQAGEIRLDKADKKDSDFVLGLRNENQSRFTSISQRKITPQEHRRWFNSKMLEPKTIIFIARIEDEKLGHVILDYSQKEFAAWVSIYISNEYRGVGACQNILSAIKNLKGVPHELLAAVRPWNRASLYCFSKSGFKLKRLDKKVFVLGLNNSANDVPR